MEEKTWVIRTPWKKGQTFSFLGSYKKSKVRIWTHDVEFVLCFDTRREARWMAKFYGGVVDRRSWAI